MRRRERRAARVSQSAGCDRTKSWAVMGGPRCRRRYGRYVGLFSVLPGRVVNRCQTHGVDTARLLGRCPGCEADRDARAAELSRNDAIDEARRAAECHTTGHSMDERWHIELSRELEQTAVALEAAAAQSRETLAICRQLDELGEPIGSKCPCDNDAVAERDRVAREDYLSWLHGFGNE